MISLDFTTLVFALSFIAFIALMQLVFFAPVSDKIAEREGKLDANKTFTINLVQEIQAKIAKFKDDPELVAARTQAHEIINAAKTEATEAKTKLIADTIDELKTRKEKQSQLFENERIQIIKNLEGPIKEITHLMVTKLLGGTSIKVKEELKV